MEELETKQDDPCSSVSWYALGYLILMNVCEDWCQHKDLSRYVKHPATSWLSGELRAREEIQEFPRIPLNSWGKFKNCLCPSSDGLPKQVHHIVNLSWNAGAHLQSIASLRLLCTLVVTDSEKHFWVLETMSEQAVRTFWNDMTGWDQNTLERSNILGCASTEIKQRGEYGGGTGPLHPQASVSRPCLEDEAQTQVSPCLAVYPSVAVLCVSS